MPKGPAESVYSIIGEPSHEAFMKLVAGMPDYATLKAVMSEEMGIQLGMKPTYELSQGVFKEGDDGFFYYAQNGPSLDKEHLLFPAAVAVGTNFTTLDGHEGTFWVAPGPTPEHQVTLTVNFDGIEGVLALPQIQEGVVSAPKVTVTTNWEFREPSSVKAYLKEQHGLDSDRMLNYMQTAASQFNDKWSARTVPTKPQ